MSQLYLFSLYCNFPEIIGTHLVHTELNNIHLVIGSAFFTEKQRRITTIFKKLIATDPRSYLVKEQHCIYFLRVVHVMEPEA
jgi:hypothetical protein